jgi:hypothetical protein
MKDHPPPEATSQQTFREDLDRQVTAALADDSHRAVLCLAQERQREIRNEPLDITSAADVWWYRWRLIQWGSIERQAAVPAANQENGWTLQSDGSYEGARQRQGALRTRWHPVRGSRRHDRRHLQA